MPRDNTDRDLASMHDMLDCIRRILEVASALGRDRIGSISDLRDATLYRFIVLGEAANRVSDECREKNPQIPWHKAVVMRNFLVHVYDKIKWQVVADTIKNDLPPLEEELRKVLDLPPPPDRTKQWGES